MVGLWDQSSPTVGTYAFLPGAQRGKGAYLTASPLTKTKQIRLLRLRLCLIHRHLEAVVELFLSAVLSAKVNISAELCNSLNVF